MRKGLLLLLGVLLLTGCGQKDVVPPEATLVTDSLMADGNDPVEETLPAEESAISEETTQEETSELVLPIEEPWVPSGDTSFMSSYEPYWAGDEEGSIEMVGNIEVTYVNKITSDDKEYVPTESADLIYWKDVVSAFAEDGYYTHARVQDFATFQTISLYDERTGYDCTVSVYKCAMYGDDSSTAIPQVDSEFEISKQIAQNEIEGTTSVQYLNADVHDNYVICNIDDDISWKYSAKNTNLLFEATLFGLEDDENYNAVMREICDHTIGVFLGIK